MWQTIKSLSAGFFLISAASATLLVSDWRARRPAAGRMPRVAIMQCASQPVLDEGVQGIKESLAGGGFIDGKNISIRQFNAENDVPTANAIANKAGKTMHVFGLVTDPFAAGVGLNRAKPLDHPPYLVGFGTFQPVEEAFRLAKTFFPNLASVGLVWNTGEASSEACTVKAREIAPKLGIRLLEANVDNSAAVLEAAASLTARGVQALWIGCDLTVNVALGSVVAAAKKARIPVFTNIPPSAKQGSLFDIGANYLEVGRRIGELGVKILNGADPLAIRIENVVPLRLMANKMALRDLKEPWNFTEEALARADVLIDDNGVHER